MQTFTRIIKNYYRKLFGLSYPYPKIIRQLENFAKDFPPQGNNYPVIDIAMLTLNRLEDTKRTLNSLYKTSVSFNLILIDQKSDDGTLEYLREFAKTKNNVKLIKLEKNLGVSGGRSLAVKHTTTEFLAFVDNDMIFMPGYFEHLLDTILSNKRIAGVFAKTITPDRKIEVNSPTLEIKDKWAIFRDADAEKLFNDPTTLEQKDCKWIPMGVSLWRAVTLKEIPIDAGLIGAYEDNDYTYRVTNAGYLLMNCPKAMVLHVKAQFTNAYNDKNYTQGRFNPEKLKFAVKHFYRKHGLFLAFGNIEGHAKYLGFDSVADYVKFLES